MTLHQSLHQSTRLAATALLAGLSLVLTGCFMTPGKFTSELLLMEDDRFTFTYEGEIFFLALSSLAEQGAAAEEFEPEPCYIDNTGETRDCTANEISGQKAAWEASAQERTAEAAMRAQQMSALMGGMDPSDPEVAEELRRHLLRQEGWERVEPVGDGVFDVRYSISGELSHDFMFPMIEDFPMTNPFVQFFLRDGDQVRINASGFAAQNDSNPMGAMLGGMAGLAGFSAMAGQSEDEPAMPDIPMPEGTFTIVTTGRILANNTDEGANPSPTGEMLVWDINARTNSAPTALIDLSR